MLLLLNANYANYNNIGTTSPKKGSLYTLNWGMRLNFFGDLNLKTEVNSSIYGLCGVEFAVSVPWTVKTIETN